MAILSGEQKAQNLAIVQNLKANENFGQAVIAGILVSIGAALIWAFVALNSGFNFTAIALLVGTVIGFGIQYVGKGYRLRFSLLGASLSLVSCLLGYYFTYIGYYITQSEEAEASLRLIDFSDAFIGFGIMDLVFLIAACGAGFAFSRRKLKPFEHNALFKEQMGLL